MRVVRLILWEATYVLLYNTNVILRCFIARHMMTPLVHMWSSQWAFMARSTRPAERPWIRKKAQILADIPNPLLT